MYVYLIKNKINNKVYVGSSSRVKRRWYEHKNNLKNNKHSCKYLQNSWDKYGENGFDFILVESTKTLSDLILKEQYWIDYYHKLNLLYNSSLIADNAMRYKNNICKISLKLKGNIRDINGDKNPNYNNKWTNTMKLHMSKINKGRLAGDKNPAKRPEIRELLSKQKLGMKNHNSRKYLLISPNNKEYFIYGGIKRKLKTLGLNYQTLKRTMSGETCNFKGWVLKNGNDY